MYLHIHVPPVSKTGHPYRFFISPFLVPDAEIVEAASIATIPISCPVAAGNQSIQTALPIGFRVLWQGNISQEFFLAMSHGVCASTGVAA